MSAAPSGKRDWQDVLRAYTQGKALALTLLGFSAGLPFLLVFSTLTAWLTEAGLSRTAIGFFAWIGITYSIKVIWSPLIDHLPLPFLTRSLGRRRAWILLAQTGIASSLVAMATIHDVQAEMTLLIALAIAVAFFSATQDLAIDAYRIEIAEVRQQGVMATAYIFGYRLALLVAGAGAFYISALSDWSTSYMVMAALMSIGMLTALVIREPTVAAAPPSEAAGDKQSAAVSAAMVRDNKRRGWSWIKRSIIEPFADFFRRHGRFALLILLFIGLYRISDITMGIMANPFYLDQGYTKIQIAEISKLFGFVMTLVGAALGGALVLRFGVMRMLVVGAALVAATNLLFAALAQTAADTRLLALVISADNFSGGLATTVFIAYLSGLTNIAYTATQYALFSSLMTLPAKFISGWSGLIVDEAGYTVFFFYAAAMGLPAIALAWWLMRRKASGLIGAYASSDRA